MTLTVTDLFCGAGGSSLGAAQAGLQLVMAANHWQTAIDVHQANFPDASHDCADISQADPRRYPKTDILLASPECTNHSQARGVSRRRQDVSLFDAPDPSAERSRATMWDVVRFAEQLHYDAMVVENVVEATKWVLWPAWCQAIESLGYRMQVLSHNSMHHAVPQSRDRIYIACWRDHIKPDLEMELAAHCPRCDTTRTVRQGFAPGRIVGRYRQQWRWHCTHCHTACEPATAPAARIIDWSLPCPRFGDKARAANTRARVLAGMQRYGWAPMITAGAGNVYETTPGNRAHTLDEPLPAQQSTQTSALATPPGFLMNTWHNGRVHDLADPHPTVCAADDRLSLVVPMRNHGQAMPTSDPLPTVTAGGNHHGLLVHYNGNGHTQPTDQPLSTVVGTDRHALLMRNNRGGAEMCTPTSEPARTMTSKAPQSLLTPPTITSADLDALVDDCGFRMLQPHEIAAAMAFPDGYIPATLPKKDRVKLAGNAVTPPVMTWITGRLAQALAT